MFQTPPSPPAVYAVTAKGIALGRRIIARYGGSLFAPKRLAGDVGVTGYDALGTLVADTFAQFRAHIFVGACGIAVRAIAPHVRDKRTDPAVVCLDDTGRFAISLLAGHLGGANALAREVAALVGAVPVVTTATDAADAPAVEMLARDCDLLVDGDTATRRVNAALAGGEPVAVFDPLGRLVPGDPKDASFFQWLAAPPTADDATPSVIVDWRLGPASPTRLYLRPKVLVAGVGCRRGTSAQAIVALVRGVCEARGLSLKSIGILASIEAKRDEAGLLEAAHILGAKLRFFSTTALADVTVPNPSATVAKHMGVASVCEAAAILASKRGRLIVPKTKSRDVTTALALAV